MVTSENHRNAALAKSSGNVIPPLGRIGLEGQTHQVRFDFIVNRFEAVIKKGDLPIRRRHRRKSGHGQGLELPRPDEWFAGLATDCRIDERQSVHKTSSSSCGTVQWIGSGGHPGSCTEYGVAKRGSE